MNAHLGLYGQAMTRLQESFSAWDEIKDRVSTIGAVFSGASFGDFGITMDELRAAMGTQPLHVEKGDAAAFEVLSLGTAFTALEHGSFGEAIPESREMAEGDSGPSRVHARLGRLPRLHKR